MKILLMNEQGIAVAKGINHIGILFPNEVEITEEQYNQINEFPLKLIFDEEGKIISWEKTELPYEEPVEIPHIPTLEEEIAELKQLIADLASLQLGV